MWVQLQEIISRRSAMSNPGSVCIPMSPHPPRIKIGHSLFEGDWCNETFRLERQHGAVHLIEHLFRCVADQKTGDSLAADRTHARICPTLLTTVKTVSCASFCLASDTARSSAMCCFASKLQTRRMFLTSLHEVSNNFYLAENSSASLKKHRVRLRKDIARWHSVPPFNSSTIS